jgi:hypothetical protein
MTGILSSTFGTFRPSIVAPTDITVTERAKVQIKTAGTNNLNSGAISMTAGRIYMVLMAWDPSGNSVPTVTLNDTANTYTQLDNIYPAPNTSAAGTGVLNQIFTTTAAATATRTITATFSASITAKTMIVLELTNATLTQRSTRAQTRSTITTLSYTGPATSSATDMVITLVGWESPNAVVSGSTSTAGGTWSAISQINTTGGTANTNIGLAYQFKILTANSNSQAITWTLGTTPNNWGSRTFVLQRA